MAKTIAQASTPVDLITKTILALIIVAGVMQIIMAVRFEVNQDEFYSLNMIYELARGDVRTPFQTVFLRMFSWLQYAPGQEVDQIVAGRLVLTLCGLMTLWLIFKTSRRFASVMASLFAVLAYFSFFYVFRHLTAFRVDGVITVFLMGAVYLSSDPKQNWKKVCASAVLIGSACLITLKSVFYLPIIAAFLLTRWVDTSWGKREFLHGLGMATLSIVSFLVLFMWHNHLMGPETELDISFLRDTSQTSFFAGGFLNRGNALATSLLFNPVGWALILLGVFAVIRDLVNKRALNTGSNICLIAFAVPLSSVFYYFHANPYYYIFMLAPAAVFVAIAADRHLIEDRKPLFNVLTIILAVMIGRAFIQSLPQNQKDQRAILSATHSIFPTPVNVIDYCGMVSSFNRVNETGWFINPDIFAMEKYYQTGPILPAIIKQYQPKLIVANVNGLDLEDQYEHQFDAPLLEQDTAFLRANYIRFWGPLYIPGKTLSRSGTFEILMTGTYTVKSDSSLMINDTTFQPGATLSLPVGTHTVSLINNPDAKLVWGDNLQQPDLPEPKTAVFNGF